MDIEKLTESVRLCGSTPKVDQCKQCAYWSGGDMSKCIPRMTLDAATALSALQAENEEMQKQLNEFSEFLCHMTGNLLSKTNYTAQAMISAAEDYQQRVCDACDEDFLFPDLPIKQAPAGGRGGHLMVEVMQFIFQDF